MIGQIHSLFSSRGTLAVSWLFSIPSTPLWTTGSVSDGSSNTPNGSHQPNVRNSITSGNLGSITPVLQKRFLNGNCYIPSSAVRLWLVPKPKSTSPRRENLPLVSSRVLLMHAKSACSSPRRSQMSVALLLTNLAFICSSGKSGLLRVCYPGSGHELGGPEHTAGINYCGSFPLIVCPLVPISTPTYHHLNWLSRLTPPWGGLLPPALNSLPLHRCVCHFASHTNSHQPSMGNWQRIYLHGILAEAFSTIWSPRSPQTPQSLPILLPPSNKIFYHWHHPKPWPLLGGKTISTDSS